MTDENSQNRASSNSSEADNLLGVSGIEANGVLMRRIEKLEETIKEQQFEINQLKIALSKMSFLTTDSGNSTAEEALLAQESTIKSQRLQLKFAQSSNNKTESKHKHIYTRNVTSPLRRPPSASKSGLLQKHMHHSNGSLQSDSPSRESVSPRASPSPLSRSGHMTPNLAGKRWNSSTTIDSSPVSSGSVGTRFSNKSLVNLSLRQSKTNLHSVSCTQLNEDEQCLKLLFKGTPLVLPVPKSGADYDLQKSSVEPSRKLILDWVYGYRGKDCRQNIFYLPTGELVYFTAAVVVLHNIDFSLQRHYLEHTDEIKSIALHPNKLLLASGQSGSLSKSSMSHIRVWNSVSLSTVVVIGEGHFTGPISCLAFSKTESGSYLAAIEDYNEKIMTVWDWQSAESGHKVSETKCSVDPIVALEFNPLDKSQIITAGKTHIAFWIFDTNGTYKRMGIFETRDKPKYVTCISFNQSGDVVTGDTNGNIAVFGRGTNTIIRILRKIHEGSIFTLCSLRNGGFISGGGKDGKLVLFQENLSSSNAVYTIEPHFGGVRVVAQGRGNRLFIGTTRNCILAGELDTEFTPLVMAHVGELNAISSGPKLGQFITGGYDRLLQLWDSLTHNVIWSKDIEEPIQCCTISPADGKTIVVGGGNGVWSVYNGDTRELVVRVQDGSDVITTAKFSPSGNFLAIGSRDSGIYIYEVGKKAEKFAKVGKCFGHTGSILAMDWSVDDQYLRSNSTSIEILYWNAQLCKQISSAATVSEITWMTQNCILTFETIGIWPETADEFDIVSSAKNDDSTILVTGNSVGNLQVFAYPASVPNALFHSYQGHSGDVSSIVFNQDNQLLSVGRNDASVLQWRVI